MAAQSDNDEKVRVEARKTLDDLRSKYWKAKSVTPPHSFDDMFDLRRAYETAAIEYAGLEGRLLRDDILSSSRDVELFRRVREEMAAALEVKRILKLAEKFIKALIALA